jgi:hypothetical protein
MTAEELCECGLPLHYTSEVYAARMAWVVAQYGLAIVVHNADGQAWWVPRHYIALHGITENDLRGLAVKYGWEMAE